MIEIAIWIASLSDIQVCQEAKRLERATVEREVNQLHYLWAEIDIRDILPVCESVWADEASH